MGAAACNDPARCQVVKLAASAPTARHHEDSAVASEEPPKLTEYTFEMQPGMPLIYGTDATDLSHRSNLSDVERQQLFEEWRLGVKRRQACSTLAGEVSLKCNNRGSKEQPGE
mmetsp:Transcript_102749/g.204044  ORF Transcript_102749/g.204044 Transcript_102749/m.204044 type:complete len:113 (+) Transcript_102749:90-428(+)